MITLLIVALPESLPTVNQCAAVPWSGPAGISAAGARGDGVTVLGHGLGGAGEVPGRAPGCCGARLSLFLLRVLSETSQRVLAELLGPVTSVSTEEQ